MNRTLILIASLFILVSCDDSTTDNRDTRCDDGTDITCSVSQPQCEEGKIGSIKEGCWFCVDAVTCEADPVESDCTLDRECGDNDYCNPCAASSCPWCDDCVAMCTPYSCTSNTFLTCFADRPICEIGYSAIIWQGCWECAEWETCMHDRDYSCDDGTVVTCEDGAGFCAGYEIKAWQDGCEVCVLPSTCEPVECHYDDQCTDPEAFCDLCASSSCPECDDCIPGCLLHDCATGAELLCEDPKPYCGDNLVVVVNPDTGCWQCVLGETCETERDEHCDDGTFPVCGQAPPECPVGTIMAYQYSCYECVDPVTCEPV